jgi:hypothetical protein
MKNEIKKIADVVNFFINDIDPLSRTGASKFLRSWNDILGNVLLLIAGL